MDTRRAECRSGQASYRGNYDRLAQVKRRYDPDNMFHVNQNIQPADCPAACTCTGGCGCGQSGSAAAGHSGGG